MSNLYADLLKSQPVGLFALRAELTEHTTELGLQTIVRSVSEYLDKNSSREQACTPYFSFEETKNGIKIKINRQGRKNEPMRLIGEIDLIVLNRDTALTYLILDPGPEVEAVEIAEEVV